MRIMLDTNVILSALLFPGPVMNNLFSIILTQHTLILSTYVVDELYEIVERKFPGKKKAIDLLLTRLIYELVEPFGDIDQHLALIRDEDDLPILHSAVTADVNILITGDKDFLGLELNHPVVMTPREFVQQYG